MLREFGGNRRLALAAYYQGPRAVREGGLYASSERYVATVLALARPAVSPPPHPLDRSFAPEPTPLETSRGGGSTYWKVPPIS